MMKKIMICVLSAILLLTFAAPSFAAKIEKGLDVSDFLKSMNVLDGEARYEPGDTVSKADFLIMALKTIGVTEDTVLSSGTQLFLDVSKDDKYAGVIEEAYKRGIIFGNDDALFGAEKPITVNEAFAIAVRCLGLEAMAQSFGGYPGGYQYVAYKTGLEDNIAESSTDKLTYKSAVNMIYNILCAGVGSELDGTYVFDSEETILNRDLRMYTAEGIVDGDCSSNLYGGKRINSGEISINGELFDAPEQYRSGYIGYNVKAYYVSDSSGKHIAYMYKKGNSEITVAASDMITYGQGKAEYYENADKEERRESLDIAPGAYTLRNGSRVIISGEMQIPDYGTFTFIDNNNDDKYDTVVISALEAMIVAAVDASGQKIYCKNSAVPVAELEEYDNAVIENSSGEKITLKDIKPDNVAVICRSEDKSMIRVAVSSETKSITLKSKYEKSVGSRTVTVFEDADGAEYETAHTFSAFSDVSKTELGNTYTFALMPNGSLLAVLSENSEKFSYGYLMAAAKKKGVSGDIQVKLFGTDNNFAVYDCADKLVIADVVSGTEAKLEGSAALSRLNAKKRLIRYSLNGDGKIKRIEFANEYGGGSGFRTVGKVEGTSTNYDSRYYTERGLIGNKIAVDPNTVAMIVPIASDANRVDEDDETLYLAQKSYFSNESRYHNAVGYASGDEDDITADVVLIPYTIETVKRDSPEMLIKGFTQGYDAATDTWLTNVTGLVNGGERTYPVSDKFDLTYKATDGTVVPLSEGDSVRFATDRYGHISSAVLLYDASEGKAYAHSQASYGAERRTVLGTPSKKYGQYLTLETESGADGELFPIVAGTYVYMYDSTKNKGERLSVITLNDIVTQNDNPDSNSKVMIYMSYTKVRYVVYYK